MKRLFLYLDEAPLGELTVDCVRGRETQMFRFDETSLRGDRPVLDPSLANVRGPQFPQAQRGFGFLSDIAPYRWGRKLIRRREKRELRENESDRPNPRFGVRSDKGSDSHSVRASRGRCGV